jgi:hypothetical protein
MPGQIERSSLIRDESGAGTAWWIFWMIIFLIFGGVAVDSSNAWRMRTELQYTADAAAHAGVVELITSQDTVKSTAIAMAEENMSTEYHGNVLVEDDVLLGIWNGFVFVEDETSPNAVRAITRRDENNGNKLKVYFLRLIGMDSWNVNALATAAIAYPKCLQNNTIYAGGIVDFKSVHNFYSPVCIHGEEGVKVRNQNLWGVDGTSLVDITVGTGMELWMPESDPEDHNPLIQWHEEPLPKKITEYLGDIIGSYSDGLQSLETTEYDEYMEGLTLPGSVTADGSNLPITISKDDWDVDLYTNSNQVVNVECVESLEDPDWNTLEIYKTKPVVTGTVSQEVVNPDGTTSTVVVEVTSDVAIPYTLQNIVLVSNCNIKFGSDNTIQDVVVGSTAGLYGAKPQHNILHFGSGNQLGAPDDGCHPAGNVTFISTASIKMAGQNSINGAQFLSTDSMHISAGTESAMDFQFTAGGDVFFAANSDFGDASKTCGDEDMLEFAYFRLVE